MPVRVLGAVALLRSAGSGPQAHHVLLRTLQRPGLCVQAAAPGPGASTPSESAGVRAAKVLGGAALTAGLVVAAIPALLSTRTGISYALGAMNHSLPGRVEIAEAQISWTGPNNIKCLKVYDSPSGGQILMHLNEVHSSAGLLHILTGKEYNVLVSKPWVNAVYDPAIQDFKLISFLEGAGILDPSPGVPPAKATSKAAPATLPSPSGSSDTMPSAAAAEAPATSMQQKHRLKAADAKAGAKPAGNVAAVLARVNSKMTLSADVRMGPSTVMVSEGMLLVPEEVREMLGSHLHISGVLGTAEGLRDWAQEVGADASWASGSGSGAPAAVAQNPSRYGPGMIQAHSDHLTAEMRVWQSREGRQTHYLLHQPGESRLDFTPALAKFGLAAANPLLRDVVSLSGGGQVALQFSPEGMRLPYTKATMKVSPMELTLGPGSLLADLITGLGLAPKSRALSVVVSEYDVAFSRDGTLTTQRVDMMLGTPARASGGNGAGKVHLVLWGTADTNHDTVDMTVGLAGPSLELLGFTDLPEGYVLPVTLKGSLASPSLGLKAAASRMGQLALRQRSLAALQRAGADGGSMAGGSTAQRLLSAAVDAVAPPAETINRVDEALHSDIAHVPARTHALPWEQQEQVADVSSGGSHAFGSGKGSAPTA